jgi:Family of unknown function (DUF6011)
MDKTFVSGAVGWHIERKRLVALLIEALTNDGPQTTTMLVRNLEKHGNAVSSVNVETVLERDGYLFQESRVGRRRWELTNDPSTRRVEAESRLKQRPANDVLAELFQSENWSIARCYRNVQRSGKRSLYLSPVKTYRTAFMLWMPQPSPQRCARLRPRWAAWPIDLLADWVPADTAPDLPPGSAIVMTRPAKNADEAVKILMRELQDAGYEPEDLVIDTDASGPERMRRVAESRQRIGRAEEYCARCGQALSVWSSGTRGFGPTCWGHVRRPPLTTAAWGKLVERELGGNGRAARLDP